MTKMSGEEEFKQKSGTYRAMHSLLGGFPGEPQAKEHVCCLDTLPMRMGAVNITLRCALTATGMPRPGWRQGRQRVEVL